jgi:hypothetical protein
MPLVVKTKIHILSEEGDFKLFAIGTQLNDLKISWLFNEEMNCKFQQTSDLIVSDRNKDRINSFGVFMYEDGPDSTFTLYSNRSDNGILLQSIRSINYILKYQGQLSDKQLKQFTDKIRRLKNVLSVLEINKKSLKLKERKLFS